MNGLFMRTKRMLTAAACAALCLTAAADVKPFAVDMYVKSPGFGYHIFRGTRTVSCSYPEAGWSVGEMKNGRICFNVADGSNHSYVAWPAIDTSWREGEWNHVAASFADGRLSLWVNGEKAPPKATVHRYMNRGSRATNACCVASVASPRAVVTNGRDAMTGGVFAGKVEDFRCLDHALDDAEVAARAAKVAERRADDPDAPKLVADEVGIDVAQPCAPVAAQLTLQPAPQRTELSAESALLSGPFSVVVPAEKGLAAVAGEILQNSLARGSGVTATVVTAGTDLPAGGTRFLFVRDAKLGREEYRIEGASEDGGYRLTVYGTDRGFVYAADTLRQLVRIRSIENGRRLSLPSRVKIEDRPLMPYRASIYDWGYVNRKVALHFAQARINSMWLNTLNKRPPVTVAKLRESCDITGACGVDVVSGFGYAGTKPWTFSDPASMDEYKAQVDLLGQGGVKGIMFMFDDLVGKSASAWAGDPEMKKRFRSQGAFHNALVHCGLDWAEAYTNLTSSYLSVCPSFYSRSWGERGRAYFADFTKGFYARGVLMHHCVYQTDDVARLMQDGAETYCYYLNGLWNSERFFTWFVCPESFRWSWYTWHVDLNGRGPVVNPEAMAGVRTLHERTPLFWCAANSDLARVQAGIISWNPAAYDPDLCDRATAQAYYGTGAYEQLRVIETALMPIIGYLGAYRTASSMEWDLQTIPRHVGPSKKEFAGYWRNYEAAEAAYAALAKAFANQLTPFDRPDLGDRRQKTLMAFRKTLDVVRKRLPAR